MEPKIDLAAPGGASTKDTLRVLTCGSVDDGKSTLIGRLLFDSKTVFDDQLAALADASRQYGTRGAGLDYALILDGLQAEREQAITIDVAYRFFATGRRRYILADAPGHEQYTRNMATGASTAQLAIVLIDARKGVLTQTRRHTRILEMMGVRHLVLAINKMDLVGFEQAVFERVADAYRQFASKLNFTQVQAIPLCAVDGDNVIASGTRMPWYTGPALLQHMEGVDVSAEHSSEGFRMPVQWVNRPNLDFRGFCGRIAQGSVRVGDAVRVLPSGQHTRIEQIKMGFDTATEAAAGKAVTLLLTDEVDVSRGDVIAAAGEPPEVADQFEARLLWMGEHPMLPGRPYLLKLHCKEVTATVTAIKHQVDVNSGEHLSAKTLALNEIAVVNVSTSQPVVFEPYVRNRSLGSFILVDKADFHTVGAGMIDFPLRRSSNIHWQALEINSQARAALMHQAPLCIWFTGLSGSGKSTLANALEKRFHADGRFTFILDGDNVRHGLNRDLGFTEADRVENIRRVAHVARLMIDAGLIVMVSFISPFRAERRMARELFPEGRFVEVFVDTPLDECERRDAKGLYGKARRGELKNFTGIDSPYETPESAEIHLYPHRADVEACVEEIVGRLGRLSAR